MTRAPLPWGWILTIALAAGLLAFALRNVHWEEVADTVAQARLGHLALAGLALALAYLLRSLRWKVLLRGERPVPWLTAYWAVWTGYLGNSLLPARAVELLRCVLLGRAAGVSIPFALATTLTERIVDAGVLVLIVVAYLATLEQVPAWLETISRTMTLLTVVGLLGLLVAPNLEGPIRRPARTVVGYLPLPGPRRAYRPASRPLPAGPARAPAPGPGAGLRRRDHSGVDRRRAGDAALVAQAFGLSLTVPQALLLLAALGLASAAPSTPGYVGVYQAVAVTVLPPFGFTESQALVYIVAFQLVSYAMVGAFGATEDPPATRRAESPQGRSAKSEVLAGECAPVVRTLAGTGPPLTVARPHPTICPRKGCAVPLLADVRVRIAQPSRCSPLAQVRRPGAPSAVGDRASLAVRSGGHGREPGEGPDPRRGGP